MIDFEFVHDNNKRYYTTETIINIIKNFNDIIKKYLPIDNDKITAWVMEKEALDAKKAHYKDGIHLVYPYVCTTIETKLLMRQDFLNVANEIGIFANMHLQNSLNDVFDTTIFRCGWMMYGSKKNPNAYCYDVTKIINYDLIDIFPQINQIDPETKISKFVNILSCHTHNKIIIS